MSLRHTHQKGPLVLKTLEDYREWSVKHRHWDFDVLEDDMHDVWVSTRDLKLFFAGFPADKDLLITHWRSMLYAKEHKTHYLSERAMRTLLLSKSKNHSFRTDVLKFLDWFERNISQTAAKKRANLHLDERNALRDSHAAAVTGPLPRSLAPPQLEESTLPFTPQERWAQAHDNQEIRRVFHPDARPIRVGWDYWPRQARMHARQTLVSLWRGQYSLLKTFCAGIVILLLPYFYLKLAAPDALDWTISYDRVLWAYAGLVPVGVLCGSSYTIILIRSLMRAWQDGKSRILALTFFLFVIPLGGAIIGDCYETDLLENWWESVSGRTHPITVYADSHLGRIVARGPIERGSAEALQDVIQHNPGFTLLEMESPGGFVIEGMRMAKIVDSRKMDTVSMELCASACTLVVVAGQDRYLGADAHMGFHRSGRRHYFVDDGWSETDYKIADFLRKHGVKEDFIKKALTEPMFRIWWAPHADMYAEGYATKAWSERKPGY